ncbi:hypothetical protein BD289DRAFT_463729 [Coniella lustricola]|uniref:Bromodomain-containing protein n=1 Tax=Coniella lustricola TaxID=2025994 RepID=A0A2T2ZUA3_9PEZI|nr:hypothetical protein BD289DRAFT_463729 [Coniella lustricola]
MTPPSADNTEPASEPVSKNGAVAANESVDTEMVDAPAEPARPPSPSSEPATDAKESTTASIAEPAEPTQPPKSPKAAEVAKTAEVTSTAESSSKAIDTPETAHGTEKKELASDAENKKEEAAAVEASAGAGVEDSKKPEDTKIAISSGALPNDLPLTTPTVPMSQMALDTSQETTAEPSTVDTSMTDAPSQSSKVAREREEDEEEPAAKRARISGEGAPTTSEQQPKQAPSAPSDAMVLDPPAAAPVTQSKPTANGSPVSLSVDGRPRKLNDPVLANNPITSYQNREIRKVLGLVKKTKTGQHFRQPVQVLWPMVWEQYRQLIARPVDISFIEQNLRDGKYDTLGHFKKDVDLLQANATTFNGATHDVTTWAKSTVSQIDERLAAIPAEEPSRPSKQEPKHMPSRHAEPRQAPPPKKESRPVTSLPTEKSKDSQIYALLPSGLPNIRRDSTKNDGDRPKRPIHPPKNKDIGFQPKTSKNKRKPELRFCEEVLKDVTSNKNWLNNQWFLEPVDPVALNIPTYHSVVKQPMDLGTMKQKLQGGEYESAKDFKADFGLIVKNCIKFNGEDHAVTVAAKELEKSFEKKWSEKSSWMAKHAQPAPAPASAASPRRGVKDEDSEDEEASEAEAEEAAGSDVKELQRAIEALSNKHKQEREQLDKKLNSNNPDKHDIEMHQNIISYLQTQMVDKRQALNKALENKKTTQPKTSKKKASSGGAVVGSSAPKKSSGSHAPPKKSSGGGSASKKPAKKKLNEEEKEIVSEAIARLESQALDKAIAIIKKDTGLKETEDDELELDMDQLSDDALVKLFDLVVKAFPFYKDQLKKYDPAPAPAHNSNAAKAAKPKKNKPMGKAEQERKLEQLRELKNSYKRPGSGSQEPLPSVEHNDGNMSGHHQDDSDEASSSEEE